MKKNRLLTFIALALSMMMALSACSGGNDPAPASNDDPASETEADGAPEDTGSGDPVEVSADGPKELIVGTYMAMTYLTPWLTTSDGDGYVIRQIYHTLVEMNQKSEFTPSLATSWEVADDGVTWTVKIRDDVYWHTGNDLFGDEKVQVTAHDVKFSYDYYLIPETNSVRYTNLEETIESIEVIDDFTVQFVLKDIDVLWEYKMYQNYIIPERGVEQDWDWHNHPVGSGAYKFVEHVIDSHVVLEKNEDFWQEPGLDKITYQIIPDRSVTAIALQNKEIDIALSVLPSEVSAIAEKDYLLVNHDGFGSYRWVGFNCTNPLFEDYEIRRALSMAVDIEGAVEALFGNEAGVMLARPAYGPITLERPGGQHEAQWKAEATSYDPEGAKAILEEKGWTLGSDGVYEKDGQKFAFTLQVGNNDASRENLAVIVSSQLKAIGIDCTARTAEWGTHTDDIKYGNVEMYILGGYSNLDGPLRIMRSDDQLFSPNCGYKNDEVDAILEEAWRTLDYETRCQLFADAATIFVSESPHLCAYYEYAQVGYNERVTDFGFPTVYQALCSTERNVTVQ